MSNKPTMQDIENAVDELGDQAGKGKDTQVKFILQMVQGGYHGTLELNASKHGTDVDDAQYFGEREVKRAGAATVERITESEVKKLAKLIYGSASHGTAQCNTANVVNARDNLRKELAS